MEIPKKCLPLHPGGGFLSAYGLQSTASRVNIDKVNPYKGY